MFEEATDNVERGNLESLSKKLVERVQKSFEKSSADSALNKRPYTPPNWADRLKEDLESEITDQIPDGADAKTPVHFGVRFSEDPKNQPPADVLKNLAFLLNRAKDLAPDVGLKAEDITFGASRTSTRVEEALFADRESLMSQTLYRVSQGLLLMSGQDMIYESCGGLGGIECVGIPDSEVKRMLADLAGVKSAERLKPGKYKVLFSPDVTGVLAHEAFGHSCEGDTCARGRSKAWDLYHSGETVGNEHATIMNNPAIYNNATEDTAAWGSYFFDEEGWLAKEHVLVEAGKLNAPMTNLTSALRLGVPRTANGKRESWTNGVYTRQTNTYFSQGDKTYDELLSQIEDGFLAPQSAGGREDPKGMGIQVGIAYLQEVKNGKLTGKYFRGPEGGDIQMTGYTPDVLNSILDKSKVEYGSSDPDSARFPKNDAGGCGKYHKEVVNAGTGGPYMLMENVTLG